MITITRWLRRWASRLGAVGLLWTVLSLPVCAQEADPDTARKNTFIPLPVAFYTPETSLGFGGLLVYNFRFRGEPDSTISSQIQLAAAYTVLDQILLYLPFRLYWQEEDWVFYGELGYYRYNYLFFGVGNDIDTDYQEVYGVDFPRAQLDLLRRVRPHLYAGLRYWFEDYTLTELEADGLLAGETVPGSAGGITSGLGPIVNYDTRDNIFYPSRGWFVEAFAEAYGRAFGSDYAYRRLTVDASRFFSDRFEHVIGFNFYGVFTDGHPPFNQMALLGGPRKMRGFYLGRFRENNLLLGQGEYRFPLFWRLGGVAFANYGAVAETPGDFALRHFRFTGGVGLRLLLDEARKLNIRADYGLGRYGSNFYLTVGEAF